MKRILSFLAIAVSFWVISSCEPDTSTKDWLNNSGWEARLEGAEINYYKSGEEKTVTITEGWVGFLIHKGTGYYYAHSFKAGDTVEGTALVGEGGGFVSQAKDEVEQPIEYEYPTIRLPYIYPLADGGSEVRYNTGTIAEDNKSIFFKVFDDPLGNMTVEDYNKYHQTFHNITFKRTYGSVKE